AAGRRAALDWARRLRGSAVLRLHLEPELDIVTAFPVRPSLSEIDAASAAVLDAGMADQDDPVFLSLLAVDADVFAARHPDLVRDAEHARVLRSVLMKPEHESAVGWLHARVEGLARA
ncbi:MAG: pyridoxal-dependent decarboxylase, partial [Solirubrobacterales bacterium]|nr:pyridoxal-dependent decarboxylase [Solirubrobacterales bacterium]